MITMQRILLCIMLSFCAPHPLALGGVSPTRLDWIDVVTRDLSTQVMINFSAPVSCKRSIDQEKHQIRKKYLAQYLVNHEFQQEKRDDAKYDEINFSHTYSFFITSTSSIWDSETAGSIKYSSLC